MFPAACMVSKQLSHIYDVLSLLLVVAEIHTDLLYLMIKFEVTNINVLDLSCSYYKRKRRVHRPYVFQSLLMAKRRIKKFSKALTAGYMYVQVVEYFYFYEIRT